MKFIEETLEKLMFASRWIMAPFYFGLVICLFFVNHIRQNYHIFSDGLYLQKQSDIVFTYIDRSSFTGNLLLIVIFSGYENFVSKIDVGDHEDKPSWMGTVDFTQVKAYIVNIAISGIHLLKLSLICQNIRKRKFIYLLQFTLRLFYD